MKGDSPAAGNRLSCNILVVRKMLGAPFFGGPSHLVLRIGTTVL